MRLDLSKGLPENVLARVRKHSAGTEQLSSRAIDCHYCEHKSIIIFEDAQGHVQTKCKICGMESVYNVVLRRGTMTFQRAWNCRD